MEEQNNKHSEDKINAGRGVAKQREPGSNNNNSSMEKKVDRPDERARKAGY